MSYHYEIYPAELGRDMQINANYEHGSLVIAKEIARISFRLPTHDGYDTSSGLVIPSTSSTRLFIQNGLETSPSDEPTAPLDMKTVDTLRELVGSVVISGRRIFSDGYLVFTPRLAEPASNAHREALNEIAYKFRDNQQPADGAMPSIGNYL